MFKIQIGTIFNGEYTDWFIKSQTTETSSSKTTYLYRHEYRKNITLSPIKNILSPERSMWQFVPVGHIKNGFYLRNLWDGSFLKALNKFKASFPSGQYKRRYVIVWTPETLETMLNSLIRPDKKIERQKPNDDSFVWIIKRSDSDYEKVTIFNAYYKEPLYAGTYLVSFFYYFYNFVCLLYKAANL